MKFEFVHNEASSRLILIFAGWGSDAYTFADVAMPGWDVAVVSGLDGLAPDISAIGRYATVYLYAWSLGVWSAGRLAGRLNPAKAFAINGTPWPCDDDRGIPQAVFDGTANALDERNLYKFRVRMCGGLSAYKQCEGRFGHIRDVERLRRELRFVQEQGVCGSPIRWDAAYVGSDDRIFPPQNQERAWRGFTRVVSLEGAPHYVDMQRIVRQTVVDVAKVGSRFTRSLATYDAHAHAQRLIASNLADMVRSYATLRGGDAIETGSGTGIFTREWSKHFTAARATFIDLCDMPVYGVAGTEEYIKGDAEAAMMRLAVERRGGVAALFSASAIQWFSNLPLFFANCARVLRPDGFMAMSTFAPGNLEELQALRPDHLQYATAGQMREMLTGCFGDVRVEEGRVELEFSSALEALRHLQLTGVTASGSRRATVGELRRFAATYPMNVRGRYTLTFRPLYLLASRPRSLG